MPTTLAGTYKYATDKTVGGHDSNISVKGVYENYQSWNPMKKSVASMLNDSYTFTATGTDANGNETGTVTFNDGGDGTWDYQVWPNETDSYDATDLYAFMGDQSTYVYNKAEGKITFTTRGKEFVVDYLLPGTYKYAGKDVTVDASKTPYTFALHFDMGYAGESRIPGFTNYSGGAARHYAWARDYILYLQQQ